MEDSSPPTHWRLKISVDYNLKKTVNGENQIMKIEPVKVLLAIMLIVLASCLHAQPVITSQPTNQAVTVGSSLVMNVVVSGSGPFTYQWRLSGTNLPNRNNVISRVAGNTSSSGYGGDGGLATSAVLWSPSGVAIDSIGNFFIADSSNHRVRMVDTNYVSTTNGLIGIIRTVAGTGSSAYFGDDGLATNAGVSPNAVAVDSSGSYYIGDGSRIRKVNTNGYITTIAGTNSSGFSGDGGPAANAMLYGASAFALDRSGNLFFADIFNYRIRKISTNGIIITVAGTNGSGFAGDGGLAVNAKFNAPYAVAVDAPGNLFIADRNNYRIRKVDTNGIITTLAGNGSAGFSGDGGAATNASLNVPNGVAVDAFGDVFFSDSFNNRIRMVDKAGNISTVAGNGGTSYAGDGGFATNASFSSPSSVAVDSFGNFYITLSTPSTIRKVDLGRVPMLILGNIAATNAGNYDVIITSPSGSVTSSVASLTVLLPPTITSQPTFVRTAYGNLASFSVSVSGVGPFSYQWFTSSGRTATADPYIFAGKVQYVFINDSGAGYVSVPQVHFIGGNGSGASASALVASGSIFNVNMINQGSGYTTPPIIQIDPPPIIIAPLLNQTNTTLMVPSVAIADVTNYLVVITNNYGSVASLTVPLIAFLTPQNLTAQSIGAGIKMQCSGTPYYSYTLQAATNLIPPINWKSIQTNSTDSSGNWQFTDTNLNTGQKFYRVRGQ